MYTRITYMPVYVWISIDIRRLYRGAGNLPRGTWQLPQGTGNSSPGYPILHFMALLAFPNRQTLENEEHLVGPRLSNGRNATCPWAHRAHQCHGAGQAPGLAVLSYTCGHWRLLGGYWDTVAGWTGGLGQPPHGVAGVLFIPVSIR